MDKDTREVPIAALNNMYTLFNDACLERKHGHDSTLGFCILHLNTKTLDNMAAARDYIAELLQG